MEKTFNISVLFVMCAASLLGCAANKKPKPEIASSADSPNYAASYPAALNGALTTYTEQTAKAKENDGAFSQYPTALDNVDPKIAEAVYKEADATGRGRAYADKVDDLNAARAFFEREKEELTRRINGSVTAAKEKAECQCELDFYGSVSYALKDEVEKRLKKQLEEVGEYSRTIEENEKTLGKKNVDTLTEQANTIAFTAHVVFVSLPTLYEEMERLLAESKAVKKTLEKEIEAEKLRSEDAATPKADKKDSKKRLAELEDAKNAIDIFQSEAERLVSKAAQEIPAARSEYEKAFDALLNAVKSQKK
jgi:hypothetical protein